MGMSLAVSEVIGSLFVGTGLLFFWSKRNRAQIFCRTVFVDHVKASLSPIERVIDSGTRQLNR